MNKINLSEKWKNWLLKTTIICIGHCRYLYLINRTNFSFNIKQLENLTEQDYGQIPDVRIHK